MQSALCETMIIVIPSALSPVMSSRKASRPKGSSPAIGSSRMRYSGFTARTPAMATLRFSPPERPMGEAFAIFSKSKPQTSSAHLTRSVTSSLLRPECFSPKATSFSTVVSKS